MQKFLLLVAMLALMACDHPLEIHGQGDIFSASSQRNCSLEQQPCSNLAIGNYSETYNAIPRQGWHFDRWEGCSSTTASCGLNVPANVVANHWGQTMPPLRARFLPNGALPSVKVLLLGDSITQAGNGYPGYRRALWFLLNNAGYNIDYVGSHDDYHGSISSSYLNFDLDNEGHWAWEAGEILAQLDSWLPGYSVDIALLHLGTNDFHRGQSNSSTIAELDDIIDKLRQYNPGLDILLAKIIPMVGTDPSSLNQLIANLAAAKDQPNSRVIVVDQYQGYNAGSDNYDTFHPNAVGADKMANKWFAALQGLLGASN